jgi:hypothetical protein
MKKTLITIICLLFNFLQGYCIVYPDTLFKVTRIKSKGDYYIIITTRNDSLFKLISKRDPFVNPNLEKLKRGGYYHFIFGDPNKKVDEGKVDLLKGNISDLKIKNSRVFIDGSTKIRFTNRFHYRLYFTKNLIGLYYVPNPP